MNIPREPSDRAVEVGRKYGTPPVIYRPVSDTGSIGAWVYEKYYEQQTSEWCQAISSSAEQGLSDEPTISNIPKWVRVLMGEHWLMGRPSYRAAPVVNRCLRFWLELQSTISDVKLNAYVHSENPDYADIAKNLTQMSASNFAEQDGDIKMMSTVQQASLGIGYTKVGIDQKAMRVVFLPAGTDSVTPILPSLYDLQDSGGIIYKAWKSMSWFWDKFSILAKNIKPEATGFFRGYPSRPYHIPEYTWNAMNPQFRAFFGVTDQEGKGKSIDEYGRVPMSLLKEFWFQDDRINTSKNIVAVGWGNFTYFVKPGWPLYPYGRLVTTAGEEDPVILSDGPNPHWHAMYPFAELRLRPVVWLYAGLSVFQDLFPLNQAINQLLADLQDYLKQILNPLTVVRQGAMSPDAWDDYYSGKPGQKLEIVNRNDPISNVLHFERPEGQGLAIIPQAIGMLSKMFDEQAGLIDSGQLTGKKQVPSGDTIEQIQNIRQSVFRLMMTYVKAHLRKVSVLQTSDILQFYNRKKAIAILGPDGTTWQNMDWDPDTYVPYSGKDRMPSPMHEIGNDQQPFRRGREFVASFQNMISVGNALPAQRQANAVMFSGLNARGKMSNETLYKNLQEAGYPVPPWSEEIERIKKEAAEMPQMQKPPKGGGAKAPKQ